MLKWPTPYAKASPMGFPPELEGPDRHKQVDAKPHEIHDGKNPSTAS